jgi:pimeloyl-ACP methyl ester carboxylesterase
MERLHVDVDGLRFVAFAEGPADGALALCLHGFPDTAHTWRHLLPALGAAGYRAVAPFMRGYAPTGPAADGRYDLARLGADANGLHDALGADDRAVVIGHDWGAGAVYSALLQAPDRWCRAVTAAVPPVAGALDTVNDRQLRRSWYSFLFQLPPAEPVLAADRLRVVERLWADWSPGYDAREDVELVRAALEPPGCLGAAIEYYRQTPSRVATPEAMAAERAELLSIRTPILHLHGADDGCIGVDVLEEPAVAFPATARVEILESCGHFLQLERPAEVNRLVLEFLAKEKRRFG